ncbi:DNA/RNA non-specific endonuclease [Fructilactobacillus florum]|uniref:Extracellular cell surface DNA-entry nuclease n=2 Tax=Fructilactobacillus florum TaxID=640331 RepID=A0A0R2CLI4_9LACO|nr:DNA/RNA non-specific endonuclease [Fructilactobacillus florum]KRM92479.1 extracellular cell surface DNA-entry nuclease precursor [Fructilactobacillus florum DSM 22689 = JCM 16035]
MKKITPWLAAVATSVTLFLGFSGLQGTKPVQAAVPESTTTYQNLQQQDYQPGTAAYQVLNNDQPETITAQSFTSNRIDYHDLDQYNRAQTATAYLTSNNLGKSEGRAAQIFKPTGWHNQPKQVNGERVFPVNRGHLIAYTCTFNLNQAGQPEPGALGSIDNPKNLFTQTAFSNQKVMTINEQAVRDALAAGKQVIYQVTPVYQGSDLMAKGVWVQAISSDGAMHFNRYLYNVQPGLRFDYQTGRSQIDAAMTVPTPPSAVHRQATRLNLFSSHHRRVTNRHHRVRHQF